MRAGEQVPRPRPATAALLKKLRRLLAEDLTVREAARRMGESPAKVENLASRYGLRASEEARRQAEARRAMSTAAVRPGTLASRRHSPGTRARKRGGEVP